MLPEWFGKSRRSAAFVTPAIIALTQLLPTEALEERTSQTTLERVAFNRFHILPRRDGSRIPAG